MVRPGTRYRASTTSVPVLSQWLADEGRSPAARNTRSNREPTLCSSRTGSGTSSVWMCTTSRTSETDPPPRWSASVRAVRHGVPATRYRSRTWDGRHHRARVLRRPGDPRRPGTHRTLRGHGRSAAARDWLGFGGIRIEDDVWSPQAPRCSRQRSRRRSETSKPSSGPAISASPSRTEQRQTRRCSTVSRRKRSSVSG